MSEERWSDETVELVARVDYEHNGGIGGHSWDQVGEAMREEWRGDARAILTALADAGLLVEPYATKRIETGDIYQDGVALGSQATRTVWATPWQVSS